jgi:autotransporter translocation and assembly factor TamB
MVRRAVEACVLGLSALALLLGLATLHLQLPAGRRAARSLIETVAHDQIAGELQVGAIDTLRLDNIVVRNVRLRDPEGRVVLSVARAEGRIDFTALLDREVRVVDLAIRRPRAHLYPSLDGTPSLVRALAPRAVRPWGPAPFLVSLDDAFLRDGRAEGVVLGAPVDVRRLDAHASLLLDGVAPRIDIVWARARVYAPLPGGADVAAHGRVVLPAMLDVRGRVTWSAGSAWTRFALDHGSFDIGVQMAPTPAPALRALWAGWPFEGDVAGWATARGTLPDLRVATAGSIGDAAVSARGRLGLPPAGDPTYDLALVLDGVEPHRLLPALVPFPIAGGLGGRLAGAGLDPATLRARFDGVLAPTRALGFPIPGGPVAARMEAGAIHVEHFEPAAPGLGGRLSGSVGLDGSVSGEATVTADRIALVQGLERIAGSGRIDTTFSVAPGQPLRLRGRGSARGLAWGPLRAATLSARYDVSLPPAGGGVLHSTTPSGVSLDVEASGTGTVVSGVSLGEVTVHGAGDQLTIRANGVATEGPRSLTVDAIVHPLPDGTGARVELPRVELGLRDHVFHGAVTALTLAPHRITIEGLALGSSDGGRVELGGWVEPLGGVSLEGHATNVDLSELSEIALGKRAPVDGRGDLHVSLVGPSLRRPRIELDARIERGRYGELREMGLTISAAHADGLLEVDLELAHRGRAALAVGGSIPLDLWAVAGPSLQAAGARDLEIEVFDVSLTEALPLLVEDPPEIAGTVSGSLALGGTWETPVGALTATVVDGRVQDIDELGLAVRGNYAPSGVTLEAAVSRRGRRIVTARGTAGLRVEEDRTKVLPSALHIARAPLDMTLAFGPFDETALPPGWNLADPIAGTVSGTGSLRGSLHDPTIGVDLSLTGARWAPLPWTEPLEAALTASLRKDGVDVRRASFARGGRPFAEIAGRVDLDPASELPRVTGMQASARIHEVDLAAFTPIQGRPVTGRASATVSVSGTPEDPQAALRVSLGSLEIAGVEYRPSELSGRLVRGVLELGAQLRQASRGSLRAEARLPVSLTDGVALLPTPESALTGTLAASAFRIDGLEAFLPEVAMVGGVLDASLALSGTRARPGLSGSIAVREGSFELSSVGQRYEEVSLTALVEPTRLVLTEVRARDRGGRATANGSAVLAGLFPQRFELHAEGTRFPVVRDGVTLADVTGRVHVTGRASREGIDATLRPVGLRVALPPRPLRDLQVLEDHPDVEIRRRSDAPAAGAREAARARPAAAGPGRFQIVAQVDIGSSVWISRNDLSFALDGRVTARIPWPGPLALQGSVSLRRGYLTAYGKNFYIQHGEVTFTGEPRFNPLLDVTALYDHPVVPVTLVATGRFERPQLSFQASGLTQEEVFAFLVLGRTDIRSTSDTTAVAQARQRQAAQLLFGIGTSWAQGELRQVAPEWLPSFSYEQGETGWDASRIRAGAQVTSDLYLEYGGNLGAEEAQNVNEARAEWRISRRWSLDTFLTFLGDRGAGGLDVLWSYSY